MVTSYTPVAQSDMRQRINTGNPRCPSNQSAAPQGYVSTQQLPMQTNFGPYGGFPSGLYPAAFQQQPFFSSPGVAATNYYPAGFVPNQQQLHNQGRSQPAFYPFYQGGSQPVGPAGFAAPNLFPPGVIPHQQQIYPQAQAYGGQYSQNAFTVPVQGLAQNTASTTMLPSKQVEQQSVQFIDLTGDDEEEVQISAPSAPAPAPAPAGPDVPVSAVQHNGLLTPETTPSPQEDSSVPEAPCHLRERIKYLKLTIKEGLNPCAFRLFRSFQFMNPKQQRNYCNLFWHSNEEAFEDILQVAKLTPDFSDMYYIRTALYWKLKEAKTEEEYERLTDENKIVCAEMERTCKARLQDRQAEEELSLLHQAVTTTKGKRTKAFRESQLEVWKEENEKEQKAKQERWAKLHTKPLSVSCRGQKRKERVEEEPAPAPKKRGRPPKVRAVEDVPVASEKKKRGRPRKSPVVQEPIPDQVIDEPEDDGALEAALYAALTGDVVEEEEDNRPFEDAVREVDNGSFGDAVADDDDLFGDALLAGLVAEDDDGLFGDAVADAVREDDDGLLGDVVAKDDNGLFEDVVADDDDLFGDALLAGLVAEDDDGSSGDVVVEEDDSLFGDVVVDDDDLFGDALLAELTADSNAAVNESVVVEPSGQLQVHEEEGCVAAAVVEDLPEEVPADKSAAVVISSSPGHRQEEESYDEDYCFERFELEHLLQTEGALSIGRMLDSLL